MGERSADHTVSALYPNELAAGRAVRLLEEAGFDRALISVMMSHSTRAALSQEANDQLSQGTVVGRTPPGRRSRPSESVAAGGALGAIVGGIAAVASLGIPGGIVVAGPLAALLGGMGAGAATGGLIGALSSLGLPQRDARHFEDRIRNGEILVSVSADSPEEQMRAHRILAIAGSRSAPLRWRVESPTV